MSRGREAAPRLIASTDAAAVPEVVAAIRAGLVAAIPTDTVYGLAAALDKPEAIARVFQLKSRPQEKAIPLLIADATLLDEVATTVADNARILMAQYWPGALTLVVSARGHLPDEVTSTAADGTRTVAVRVPDHPVARQVLAAAGGILAVTSANRSGEPPALDGHAVLQLGAAAPDIILDAGPAPVRAPSTVVAALGGEVTILREGAISSAAIAASMRHATLESSSRSHAV